VKTIILTGKPHFQRYAGGVNGGGRMMRSINFDALSNAQLLDLASQRYRTKQTPTRLARLTAVGATWNERNEVGAQAEAVFRKRGRQHLESKPLSERLTVRRWSGVRAMNCNSPECYEENEIADPHELSMERVEQLENVLMVFLDNEPLRDCDDEEDLVRFVVEFVLEHTAEMAVTA